MDYGIIFIIIIVIVIIIAIILIIYANRGNTQNLLLTLPNYRIERISSGDYLSLTNLPNIENAPNTEFPIYTLDKKPFLPFWSVLVAGGASIEDSFGLWKINIIKQITFDVSEVQLINDVYLNESPGLSAGLLSFTGAAPFTNSFTPFASDDDPVIFLMKTIDVNTFTFTVKNSNLPIIVDPNTNLLVAKRGAKNKPDVFKLNLV